ncbi:MAG: hypothetical protein KA352_15390 [Flavobacteriales bacterium]|nr:hypothetical protein [Flavobacteriales bacterium]
MRPLSFILKRGMITMACASIILVPALINGFPFVYADTGTYVRSAFEGYVPFDRPYWYGPFIRATSLGGTTLWGVVIAQAILCASYVLRISSLLLPTMIVGRVAIAACMLLSIGTGLGWYAGQVLPDIFTGIGLLAVFLLVRGAHGPWLRAMDSIVIAAACWMHLSNLLILPLAGMSLLLIGRSSPSRPLRPGILWLASATVLGWGGLALANRIVDGNAYVSRSSHVFLIGRMLDTGMLRPYLMEHCPTEQFGICAYIDSLPPHSQAFLWWDSSPVVKQGGWEATREEYDRIVRGSFTEPRFIWWHVRGSLASTWEQLGIWEICKGSASEWHRAPDGPTYRMLATHLPHELDNFLGSMQNGGRGGLDMRWPDLSYRSLLALAVLAAAWALVYRSHDPQGAEARTLVLFSLLAIVIGAWVCATLSVVDARYLARDSWLLPFAVILFFAQRMKVPAPVVHGSIG